MNFKKLGISFDVAELHEALRKSDAWDLYPHRRIGDSPHAEMVDIWARFADISDGYMSRIGGPHEAVWYPCADNLANLKFICNAVCEFVGGEYLGGVLITRLPPGGEIKPHIDSGWHAKEYEKIHLSIATPKGSSFHFENDSYESASGECYWFRNDVSHWVKNDSQEYRISVIICVKTDQFEAIKCK